MENQNLEILTAQRAHLALAAQRGDGEAEQQLRGVERQIDAFRLATERQRLAASVEAEQRKQQEAEQARAAYEEAKSRYDGLMSKWQIHAEAIAKALNKHFREMYELEKEATAQHFAVNRLAARADEEPVRLDFNLRPAFQSMPGWYDVHPAEHGAQAKTPHGYRVLLTNRLAPYQHRDGRS